MVSEPIDQTRTRPSPAAEVDSSVGSTKLPALFFRLLPTTAGLKICPLMSHSSSPPALPRSSSKIILLSRRFCQFDGRSGNARIKPLGIWLPSTYQFGLPADSVAASVFDVPSTTSEMRAAAPRTMRPRSRWSVVDDSVGES
jgi:hypothetical protein